MPRIMLQSWKALVTVLERISIWLREVGGAYCDGCIAKELKLSRRRANQMTNALSQTANFCREQGICSLCGRERMVIEAV